MTETRIGLHDSEERLARLKELGVETERNPAQEVVLVDIEVESAFGDGRAMFDALLAGESAVEYLPEVFKNPVSNLGALLPTSPKERFADLYTGQSRKDIRRRMAESTVLVDGLVRTVGARAGLLDEDSYKLRPDLIDAGEVNPNRVSYFIGGGMSPTEGILATHYEVILGTDRAGNPVSNRVRTDLYQGMRNFPQDHSSRPAMTTGGRGASGSLMTACSTSQNNFTVGFKEIKNGYSDFAFVGAADYNFNQEPEDAMAWFTLLDTISKQNDDPKRASRPYDRDRDGFVPGSGAGIALLARRDAAERIGLPIRAVVVNSVSTIDGGTETLLDERNVARTASQARWNEENKIFEEEDFTIGHATSTPKGDLAERRALYLAEPDRFRIVPLTSNKGNLGHTVGASGMMNIMEGILAMEEGVIPHVANLENPDEVDPKTCEPLAVPIFVAGQPLRGEFNSFLSLNYGFGGNNSAEFFRKS
jgi:3-oxoacyl-(acyl-carrier-protein) synthase